MLAYMQAVYTSGVADAFTDMRYCAFLTVWKLYHDLCSLAERELTQVPTQQKKLLSPIHHFSIKGKE